MIRTRPSAYSIEIRQDDALAAYFYQAACEKQILPVRPVTYMPGWFVFEVSALDINEARKILAQYEQPL